MYNTVHAEQVCAINSIFFIMELQACYAVVVGLSILFIFEDAKFAIMAFLSGDGHVRHLVGTASQIVLTLTTIILVYNMLYRWNNIIDLLNNVALSESMYLNRTRTHISQVSKYLKIGEL